MKSKFNRMLQAAAASAIVGLFIAAGFVLGGQAPAVSPQVVGDLGNSDRYLTHVATDKPIYRTGEKLYVRGVVLRADGHSPITNPQDSTRTASFEIKGPKGDTVASGVPALIHSTVGFSWDIPANQAGGEYTVRIFYPSGDVPAERKFDIRAYRAPRLKSQIVFVRDGYGPGDTVAASLHVERAEGGVPAGAKVSVSARVDGDAIWNGETAVDGSGNAGANFRLPAAIARGEGVIAMIIQDGGTVETATKTIPILLQTIDLAIYPEEGDLIAGLPNRVYLEGRTPTQKPADMVGVIVNAAGKEVATFRTEHEGRGRFSFVPAKGETYSLRITEPAGIKTVFPLPSVKESGVVLSSTSDVTPRQKDVVLRIAATAGGAYGVALTQHGKEFSFKPITLKANQPNNVTLTLPRSLDGVIVATIYDDRKTPMAERLLFRQPETSLKVKVVADRTDYVPGDKVTLRIVTTDDMGKPVGAVVGLTVTDSSVLEMIEKREQAPRLPVMVLLESDVRNLSDAHVYLDESNPKAPLATDLLLGTQGWRRFATAGAGSLNGTITDSTSAVIPGVTVRATNTSTGVTLTAITNRSGAYVFPGANSGTYRVSASLPGFETRTVTGLKVTANNNLRQDLRLAVATVNKMMAEVAVWAQRAVDLPLNGRNMFDLVDVLPEARKDGIRKAAGMVDEIRPILGPVDADRQQGQQGQAGRIGGGGGGLGRPGIFARNEALADIVTVREYAHTPRPNWTEGSRVDFAGTGYWNAGVKTDASTGIATLSFNLSDSVTSFRVLADGFTQDGTLGSSVSHVESVQPFSIEPKIPLQVTSGDVIQLPIGIVNGMSRDLRGAEVTAGGTSGLKFTRLGDNPATLRPKERTRRLFQIDVGREFSGPANLTLDARAGRYRDTVSRKLDAQPLGFPHQSSTC